jgi:hypothetical protein
MYLYGAIGASSADGKPLRHPPNWSADIVSHEMNATALMRRDLTDKVSSKLQLKGPRLAEALQRAEITQLRHQLHALPEELLEHSRTSYMLAQNNKRRNLQEFQCNFLVKLEHLIKEQLVVKRIDFRKYKIGGYDEGAYGEY